MSDPWEQAKANAQSEDKWRSLELRMLRALVVMHKAREETHRRHRVNFGQDSSSAAGIVTIPHQHV